ncbi:hypothetical protein FGW37_10680 [Streptomyces rectiverticillatus]|uniref:hypothetical protein n=1 Tax=Streptomyces rectiverticillatus TaxID=173860 RepID=UPI0015C39005|nr:hypothetical protein [Streptomyces rectiverticillatus]QLE72007.1 hypothetical protein FGW37_10680 [Streptomyces rectiverticillatus]
MKRMHRFFSPLVGATVLGAVLALAGPAAASDRGEPGPSHGAVFGGLLSGLGSKNADAHSSTCGGPRTNVGVRVECSVNHGTHDKKSPESTGNGAVFGGALSNIASGNASDHSNSCGNGLVSIMSHTTCTVHDHR